MSPKKKAAAKKADPKKADPKKADPQKADPKKADPKKAGAKKVGVRKGGAKGTGAEKAGAKKAGAKKATGGPARKSPRVPELIVIPHDDHHGQFVGKTSNGHQFFITTPFEWLGESREFVALYVFDAAGNLLDAIIDEIGDRAALVGDERAGILPGNKAELNSVTEQRIAQHLQYVGPHELQDISVRPFEIERHGVQFGLIPRLDDDEDGGPPEEVPYVLLLPGDYMAFTPPWDGSYDT